jgi:hypothetical protein
MNNRSNILGNQVIPLFDLFDPKRGILILTLRTVIAETHRYTFFKSVRLSRADFANSILRTAWRSRSNSS